MMTKIQVNATRKIALVTGILMIITFITSIPAQLVLYHPLLSDPATYMHGSGADRPCRWVRSWKSSW